MSLGYMISTCFNNPGISWEFFVADRKENKIERFCI